MLVWVTTALRHVMLGLASRSPGVEKSTDTLGRFFVYRRIRLQCSRILITTSRGEDLVACVSYWHSRHLHERWKIANVDTTLAAEIHPELDDHWLSRAVAGRGAIRVQVLTMMETVVTHMSVWQILLDGWFFYYGES